MSKAIELQYRNLTALAAAVLIVLLFSVISVSASTPVHQNVLPNGMVLIVRENNFSDLVAVDMMIGATCFDEGDNQAGIRALLQEYLLRKHPGEDGLEAWGSQLTVDIGMDYVEFGTVVVSDGFEEAVAALAGCVVESDLEENRLQELKQQRLNRLVNFQEAPFQQVFQLFREGIYEYHPCSRPVDGTAASIAVLSPADLQTFHNTWYVPNNTIVAVSGNVSLARAQRVVQKAFAEWKPRQLPERERLLPFSLKSSRAYATETRAQNAQLLLGFTAPPAGEKKEYADFRVIEAILSGGMSGRLQTRLRNEMGAAYEISIIYPALGEQSYFAVHVVCAWHNVDEVKSALIKELNRILQEPVTAEELRSAQQFIIGQHLRSLQHNRQQAYNLAWQETLGLGAGFGDEYPKLVGEVTPESLQATARKYMGKVVAAVAMPGGK